VGADLAICGRDGERIQGAAGELRAVGGGPVEVFVADLSSQSQVRRRAEEVWSAVPGSMCWSTTSGVTQPGRRLRLIKGAQRAGLGLREIGELLQVADQGQCPCGHTETLLQKRLAEVHAELQGLHALVACQL
jgi:MerR-like DNA binding protein